MIKVDIYGYIAMNGHLKSRQFIIPGDQPGLVFLSVIHYLKNYQILIIQKFQGVSLRKINKDILPRCEFFELLIIITWSVYGAPSQFQKLHMVHHPTHPPEWR